MAKKVPLFGPGGSNFDPFFAIFFKSLVNMPTNIILKNQKNSFARKIYKSKKLQKLPKKGRFLALEGQILTLFSKFFENHF